MLRCSKNHHYCLEDKSVRSPVSTRERRNLPRVHVLRSTCENWCGLEYDGSRDRYPQPSVPEVMSQSADKPEIQDLRFKILHRINCMRCRFFFFYTWRCVGVAGSSCNEELDVVGSCCNEELDVVESSCNQTRYCMMFLQPWNRWIIIIAATTRCRVFMQTRTRCYRNFLQQQADVIGTSYNNELDVVGSFCKNKLHGVWTFCNHELDIAGYSCKNE